MVLDPPKNKPHIIYILSQFPEMHETFIVRELKEISNRGFSFSIISLKKCRDLTIYPEAKYLQKNTTYPSFKKKLYSIYSMAFFIITQPITFSSIFYKLLKDNYHNFLYLSKSLFILPRSAYIAWKVKNENDTLIHAHWATVPTTCAWIVSSLIKKPYLFTAHAWDIFLHPGNLSRLIECSSKVVTCTNYNKDFLLKNYRKCLPEKINVIHHGLELYRFHKNSHYKSAYFTILAVGRLVPQKGFDALIKACELLKKRSLLFRCYLIGSGPLENELKKLSCTKNVSDQINFLGQLPHDQVLDWMHKADVFVAPSVIAPNSDRDGIPNVILEAMALKLAVVGSNVSGIPEVVIDSVTGLLVEPGDSLHLSLALKKIHDSRELAIKLGANGRKLMEQKFNIQTNINQLEKIYADMSL